MEAKSTYSKLEENNFESKILQGTSIPKVVVFNASWLGSGQMMDEIIHDLAGLYDTKFEFFRVEADDNIDLLNMLGISDVPVIMVFKNGKVVSFESGMISDSRAREILQNAL
ncbi:MAG: thioredoxin family protein [Saprospiraceae bacterium]|nr:thioredoxin family protein [Saprospiraceae bacterium]